MSSRGGEYLCDTPCTMSEVRNLVKTIESPRSVVLLAPAGVDECDQASDNEEVPKDFEMAFEPADVLKMKERR